MTVAWAGRRVGSAPNGASGTVPVTRVDMMRIVYVRSGRSRSRATRIAPPGPGP